MSIAEKLTTVAENVPKVYEAGQKAEYDKFWDSYQQNGNRTDYANAFGSYGWNGDIFYPKYNMKPSAAYMMFRYFDYPNVSASDFDLVARLKECGVEIDFSGVKASGWQYAFYAAAIKTLPILKINASLNSTFVWWTGDTIEKIILPATVNTIKFTDAFTNANRFKNVIFEGLICNDIAFPNSPLTVESMKSIINSLYDYSGPGKTYTLTFKADRESLLPQEYKDIATNKGWTLVWS